jgi:hypothetical protein
MAFIEQTYKDGTLANALERGCDIVQLKYDGWFDRMEFSSLGIDHFSSSNRVYEYGYPSPFGNEKATLLGENLLGTQWAIDSVWLGYKYLFDCICYNNADIRSYPYRERYKILQIIHPKLPFAFKLVQCYPINQAKALWDSQVATEAFEGVVYRRSVGDFSDPIIREKRTVTEDLLAIGFIEGTGRLTGMLGAIIGKTFTGVTVKVGGGFTDSQRIEIWANQPRYQNTWFEVTAKLRFKSGSLRHPNFNRWRTDK